MKLLISFITVFLGSDICLAQGYNRVHPNQGYRTQQEETRRVRKKPYYGRVNPNDYRRIIDQSQNQKQQPVYPQQHAYQKQYQQYQQRYQGYPQYQQNQYQYKRQPQQYQPYQQPYNPYHRGNPTNPWIIQQKPKAIKKPNYKPKWPKLKGQCKAVPSIFINGENPIKKECGAGKVTLVFLMKRRCDFCYHQLKKLEKLAKHYTEAGKPLSVIAINHKRGILAPAVKAQFPHIKIYEEPSNVDVFGTLGGAWRQVILYDVCCRKQYLYGYPFSWMGYSYLRHAIFNTMYYDQVICGVCKAPKWKQKLPTTTIKTTTIDRQSVLERAPPGEEVPPREETREEAPPREERPREERSIENTEDHSLSYLEDQEQ